MLTTSCNLYNSHLPLFVTPLGVIRPNPFINLPGEGSDPDIIAGGHRRSKEDAVIVAVDGGEVPSIAHAGRLCLDPGNLQGAQAGTIYVKVH